MSSEKWAQMIGYINDLVYVCAPSPLQLGVARGINSLPSRYYAEICEQYSRKRDMLCQTLMEIDITPFVPQGAYYVLANVSRVPGNSSREKALFLLHNYGVAVVPGEAFFSGEQGENLVRFCFAKDDEILDRACQQLRDLKKL